MLEDAEVHDFEYGGSDTFSYYRCTSCSLLQIHPVPDERRLAQAYPETYHAYHEHHSRIAALLKKRFWRMKAEQYSVYLTRTSNVLELGCSFGDLIQAFQKHGVMGVQGIDVNSSAVAAARARGLQVQQGDLENTDLPEDFFDMIVAENFIEHVYDPVQTLRRCRQLLKVGGVLVGETPNIDAWDFKLSGRHWGGYHCPRHICIFNHRNLGLLADIAGFSALRIHNVLQPAHWVLSVQNALQDSRLKTSLKNGRSWYFAPMIIAAMPLNILQQVISYTSSMGFVFQKPLAASGAER